MTVSDELPVVVIGGGQAGLSMSWHLKERGVEHVVLERHHVGYEWEQRRWDNFCLVTPNWQCDLPGFPYAGGDPDGFMVKSEIIDYLKAYAASFGPPLRTGVSVTGLTALPGGGFLVATTAGELRAGQVVVATGGYHEPRIPRLADRLPSSLLQLHSSAYKGAATLPDGAVLVVGSGQSGAQVAEDLHLDGRQVHLATGSAPRCARFYRGRDVVAWLADMHYYDLPVQEHSLAERVRLQANHYVTGRDGGRDIDLRAFALEGMQLYGHLAGATGTALSFAPDLARNLDAADMVYNGINASIDSYIAEHGVDAPTQSPYEPVWAPAAEPTALDLDQAGITSVVWASGYIRDYAWIDLPLFTGSGYPAHTRGVTNVEGVYFLGLPWLHTWGSGRFSGVARDAAFLADRIGLVPPSLSELDARPADEAQETHRGGIDAGQHPGRGWTGDDDCLPPPPGALPRRRHTGPRAGRR